MNSPVNKEKQFMEAWYVLVLAGVVCGVLSAMFGVGSGIIMVPLLVIGLAFPQKAAQGSALAVMVPMALVGAIRYRMNPEIDMNVWVIAWLAAGGVIGAFVGAKIVAVLPSPVLRKAFAVLLVISAVNMFFKSEPKAKQTEAARPAANETVKPAGP
jgi:uncharacterized protein